MGDAHVVSQLRSIDYLDRARPPNSLLLLSLYSVLQPTIIMSEASLPTHAKDNPNVAADGAPSKNALKKAQKEAEKAAKKAAAKKADEEKRAAQQAQASEDTAKENYGDLPDDQVQVTHLKKLSEEDVDKDVTIITRVHNSRSQSAKLAFLMLRQQGRTIQAVVAASSDAVSKQMVKWATSVNVNSFVRVTGVVKKPDPPVASATISNLELHVKKIYLKYFDGIKMLRDAGVDTTEQDNYVTDLTTAQEKKLGQLIREKYDTDFYVLDEFPMSVRPFYTKGHPTDPKLSNSYDFFMRGEEIMSGAQRVNDAAELEAAMRGKGVDPSSEGFVDYVNAFKQGCRPHAGGGLGLNRIVMFFLGLDNVRQATPFPRDPQRLRP